MTKTFVSLVPNVEDLLALEVEDLGGVVMEVLPSLMQNQMVHAGAIVSAPFALGEKYPENYRRAVYLALAEAISWLESQGLIVQDPEQPATWYRITRRGQKYTDRIAIDAYRKGKVLPSDLLQTVLSEKVRPQFLRGDYDVAVFQAFKIVEVSVREAANKKGADFADNVVGVDLMRQAFHVERGNLTDKKLVPAEREAMSALFAGAIGHAKNPSGHRNVELDAQNAARLIIFASHLLDILTQRERDVGS